MEKEKELKFDKAYLKRTLFIGMAFFGILLVWQLYNSYCSPMLSFRRLARRSYVEKVLMIILLWLRLRSARQSLECFL